MGVSEEWELKWKRDDGTDEADLGNVGDFMVYYLCTQKERNKQSVWGEGIWRRIVWGVNKYGWFGDGK